MNIYDIAAKAGVSIATVSRVLNSSPHVSEKTRARVLQIMEQEGYVPNAFARGLGLDSMNMIGVMCTDITDMFYAGAVGCIERLLRAKGMDTVLCCTGNELEGKKESLAYLVSRKVDAVILIGSAFKEETDNSHIRQAARDVPVVILNGYVHIPNVYCVVCDERHAMKKNVTLLHQSGCRRILYLYNTLTYSGSEKLRGYREGCKKHGLPQDGELVVMVDKDIAAVGQTVSGLLERGVQFDAVVASEDILAVGALNALRAASQEVPVIGFNNSLLALCTSPTLTSVDNMNEAMCEAAVRLLSDIAEGKEVSHKTVLSSRLVERESFPIG